MLDIYWACLIGGALFTLASILLGDLIGHALHLDALHPLSVVGGITVFGGAGVLFGTYSALEAAAVLAIAILIVAAASLLIFFLYVRPMRNTENSTGFSIQDLQGRIAEVTVPVPAKGFGEVLVKIGAGNTNQIAASFSGEAIQAGTRVVVVEVRDDTLFVARFE